MGKTLKRQRARELKQQQQQQQPDGHRPCKIPRMSGMPALNSGSSSSKFTFVVSAAMQAKNWVAALQTLQAMAAYGKVPKLGAIQRWVRDADMAGNEAATARLIDAILRCTMPKQDVEGKLAAAAAVAEGGAAVAAAAAAAVAAEADLLKGRVIRHPPWSPPLPAAAAAAADKAAQQQQQQQQNGSEQQQQKQQQQQQQQDDDGLDQQDSQQQQQQQQQQQAAPTYAELLYQVPFQPGAGGPDAIYTYPPGKAVQYDDNHPPVTAVQVPFVPGAQCLVGVLSKHECEQIIAAAEAIGYNANVDYTFGGAIGGDGGAEAGQPQQQDDAAAAAAAAASADVITDSMTAAGSGSGHGIAADKSSAAAADKAAAAAAAKSAARGLAAELVGLQQGGPAQGCVWLVDESVLGPLYKRVAHLLPQDIDGGALAGINARWRLYRYTPGNVYRPHIDGAWPGSGLDADGQYVFDAFGDRWSRLTFLVYLNDDFEGGHTTYYTANEEQVGVLDARGVRPRQGNVMVFPHGGTVGSLVHEGSAVITGAKYVIRTDVLYLKPPAGGQRQQQQQQQQQQQRESQQKFKKQKRR